MTNAISPAALLAALGRPSPRVSNPPCICIRGARPPSVVPSSIP